MSPADDARWAHMESVAAQLQSSVDKLQGSVDKLSARLASSEDRVGWEEFQRDVTRRLGAIEATQHAPTDTRNRIVEAVATAFLTAVVLGGGALLWQSVTLRPAQGATPRPVAVYGPTPGPGGHP